MKKLLISVDDANKILNFLAECQWKQVAQLIAILQNGKIVEELNEKPEPKPE